MDMPDHIPHGVTVAEGYRLLADGLETAATDYTEDELRAFVHQTVTALRDLARSLGSTE